LRRCFHETGAALPTPTRVESPLVAIDR